MTKEEIKLAVIGTPVKIRTTLHRSCEGSHCNREWRAFHFASDKWKPGYLTGYAYLQNGSVSWYEDHSEWEPKGPAIFTARVKYSNRGREYYALPEDVEILYPLVEDRP